MSVARCAVCATGFSARSDAVYCSSACRQKAHRARTAQRLAELADRAAQTSGRPVTRGDIVATGRRARDTVNRSRELCLTAAERLQQAAATHERCRANWPVTGLPAHRPAVAARTDVMERAACAGN